MTWDSANWMSKVAGGKMLSELNIPGTHDSFTGHIPEFTRNWHILGAQVATQDRTIAEQLERGIRYIDIRLKLKDGELICYHSFWAGITFQFVLDMVEDFLKAHDRETVIMLLSHEGLDAPFVTDAAFETAVAAKLCDLTPQGYTPKAHLWNSDMPPTLEQVRGKIVILRRFVGPAKVVPGMSVTGWPDNDNGMVPSGPFLLFDVQDKYRPRPFMRKFPYFSESARLTDMEGPRKEIWNINYASFVSWLPNIADTPRRNAERVNSDVKELFESKFTRFRGTVVLDFAFNVEGLVELIASGN